MKLTGIVRKLDSLGRVVIPMELRRAFEIKEGDPIEIMVEGDDIVLRKYRPGCVLCGSMEKDYCFMGDKRVCIHCARALAGNLK